MSTFEFGELNAWQKSVFAKVAKKQFVVVAAGRRSGKTHLIRALIHITALTKKSNIAVVYPSLKHGKSILFNEIVDDYYAHKEYFSKKRGIYKPLMEFRYFNDSTLKFYSLERPDDLRGMRFDLVIMDEGQELEREENIIDSIIEPTLTPTVNYPAGHCIIFGTSKGRNAFYNLVLRGKSKTNTNWETYIIPTTEKNCPHILPGYLEEKRLNMNPQAYAREYLCSFESYEGLIYSEFKDDIHIVNTVPPNAGKIVKAVIGLDFGYSPHPMGIVVLQKTASGNWYVVENVKAQKLTATEDSLIKILRMLVDRFGVTSLYLPPEENHGKQIIQKAMPNLVVKNGDNKVADGINYLRTMIHYNHNDPAKLVHPKLYVCSNCGDLINEFMSYSYKDGTETPLKLNDDLLDALRYGLFTESKVINTRMSNQHTYY